MKDFIKTLYIGFREILTFALFFSPFICFFGAAFNTAEKGLHIGNIILWVYAIVGIAYIIGCVYKEEEDLEEFSNITKQ